jgi:hypothetical protein
VLRRIFRPKREKVTGDRRHHHLYTSPDIIRMIKSRRMRREVYVICMGNKTNVYKILVRKAEGNRPLGRSRLRWEDNIRMDLREI